MKKYWNKIQQTNAEFGSSLYNTTTVLWGAVVVCDVTEWGKQAIHSRLGQSYKGCGWCIDFYISRVNESAGKTSGVAALTASGHRGLLTAPAPRRRVLFCCIFVVNHSPWPCGEWSTAHDCAPLALPAYRRHHHTTVWATHMVPLHRCGLTWHASFITHVLKQPAIKLTRTPSLLGHLLWGFVLHDLQI